MARAKAWPSRRADLSESDVTGYEWIEEGKPYREWLIPAALINARMSVLLVGEEEIERDNGVGPSRSAGSTPQAELPQDAGEPLGETLLNERDKPEA